MKILSKYNQLTETRNMLKKEGLSFAYSNNVSYLLKRLNLPIIQIGEFNKSWDIYNSLDFINNNLAKDAKILDVGCYGSEILLTLYKSGFKNIHGIDTNPKIKKMPYSNKINYHVGNLFENKFQSSSFDCITSISVIEHGYDEKKFFTEFSRLLKKDGYLILTFDYWDTKIKTDNIKMFDLSWNIFSKKEVKSMIINAKEKYNLELVGNENFEFEDAVINCANKNYTFAWLVFKKID